MRSNVARNRPILLLLLAAAALSCQTHGSRPSGGGAAVEANARAATLAGFTDTVVFSGRNKPVAVRFAPNGRVFVLEKGGRIYLYDSLTDTTPTLFLDYSARINSYWDRGLSGLALHPNYPSTPHVYLLYTHDTASNAENNTSIANRNGIDDCPTPPGGTDHGCVSAGVLSRMVDTGSYPLTTANETILITEWPQQYPGHSVQHLAFGPDGFLYASAGDGAMHNIVDAGGKGIPVNPTGDPANWAGALRVQSLRRPAGQNVVMSGAVIRIDPATGAAASTNPNISHPDPEGKRIIAFGLRNPFRFTFHPTSGEIWVGDVGAKLHDEINRFAIGGTVENFGWPCYEGPNKQGGFDSADLPPCESLYSTTQHVAPFFSVGFNAKVFPADTCGTAGGTAISGLAFYPSAGGNFPSQYQGAFFFSDYSRGCIWVMSPGAGGTPDAATVATFATALPNIVDLQVGPGGDLYYVSHSGGSVRRIRYQAPSAIATATPTAGAAPLTVQFNGSGSTKVSPTDTLSYAWDLDGDGQFDDSTAMSPTFVYTAQGTHSARLRVTDQLARSGTSNFLTITVGNPPVPVIDTPVDGTQWIVNDTISFSGHASDPDQGPLAASALSWELFLEHCPNECHSHSVTTWNGVPDGSFPAPDHEYPSFLRLVLKATDATGISATTERILQPRTVDVTFDAAPVTTPRLKLGFNFESLLTPFTRTVIIGSAVSLAASTQSAGGQTYVFSSWSDGGAANHSIVAGPTPATYTATFVPSPWVGVDVGAVMATGSFSESNGTFTVRGSGADIYNAADEFHFVYRSLVGDGTVTARVNSIQNTNVWAKAGVMMRESTAAGARNVAAVVSPTASNQYRLQARTSTGGSSSSIPGGAGTTPVFLRVSRTGNVFTTSFSNDGQSFTALGGPQTIAMNETILVGLAVTSHADGTVATGVFDNVTVTTPAPPTPPPAPGGLTATAGNGQIALGWTPPPNTTVSSYSLKWSTTAGGPYTSINGITGTSFTHTNLPNGVRHYYVVAAVNAAGEGNPSAEVSAVPVPPPPPPVPTGLSASPGNAQVALGWNASSGATSYVLRWATAPGGPYTDISGLTATSYTHTGLANGTTYYYVVAAVGGGGPSASSAEVSATPSLPPAPDVPTGLTATAGNAQVALTWNAAARATGYTLEWATDSAGPWNPIIGITATSYTHTGRSNGTTYFYRVSAAGEGGSSAASAHVSATPSLPPAPDVPTGLTATAGNTQVTLSWNAALRAQSYVVKWRTSPTGTPTSINVGGTSHVHTGLTNGTTYYYTVAASGEGGTSADSAQVSATPSAPAVTWLHAALGAPTPAGSFTQSGATYTIKGAGTDIQGTADQGHFAYRTISGNVTIIARMASLSPVTGQTFTKGGLMMRNGTAAGAQNAFVLATTTNSNGFRFQHRLTTNGSTTQTRVTGSSAIPTWFRLVRVGNAFTASTSTNGSTWSVISTVNITMPTSIQVGFAVTSHVNGTLTTGVFDSVTVTTP